MITKWTNNNYYFSLVALPKSSLYFPRSAPETSPILLVSSTSIGLQSLGPESSAAVTAGSGAVAAASGAAYKRHQSKC